MPAITIADRLISSWAIAPRQSDQSPKAAATPIAAAAGIVVTEISTPISAPDLAEVSESIPATPAKKATMKEKVLGSEMNAVSGRSPTRKPPPTRSVHLAKRPKRKAAVIPIGKPTASASRERRPRSGRRCTSATQRPASGPNSGPTTIAPTIRIGWPSITPAEAIRHAITMQARKLAFSSMFSEVRASTSSQTTESPGEPLAARSARSASGSPGDSVVWEEVEARTSENIELNANFLACMVIACLIASAGVMLGQPILIVGAMVVGPEFGPLAGLCVALVQRRPDLGLRSLLALAVGFPIGITAAFLFGLFAKWTDLVGGGFLVGERPLTAFISEPSTFSFIVAFFAGVAGMLSLTSAKSGALIGVLISVTTIPAAAAIGVAAAFGDWSDWRGAIAQLLINLSAIVIAGIATLLVQNRVYERRRSRHRGDHSRAAAGLSTERSRR